MKLIHLLRFAVSLQLCDAYITRHGTFLSSRRVVALSGCAHAKPINLQNLRFPSIIPLSADRRVSLAIKSTESSNDTEETTELGTGRLQRRRRRRKQQSPLVDVASQSQEGEVTDDDDDDDDAWEEEEDNAVNSPNFDLKPRENAAVAMQVKDVRAVVGLMPESEDFDLPVNTVRRQASLKTQKRTKVFTNDNGLKTENMNSFERLLADAKQMKLQEEENEDDDEGNGVNVPTTIRSILSTIVTIDFFIICAFLVWFLAGVVSSSFFHNDDIQIAFNSKCGGTYQATCYSHGKRLTNLLFHRHRYI